MATFRLEMKTEREFWWFAAALFALLATLMYWPALDGQIPFPRDVVLRFPPWAGMGWSGPWKDYANIGDLATAFYPSRMLTSRAIHEGTFPLWNPYILGGAPFLASPQSSLFYPPNFLYYVLPVPAAWTLCLMLRVFLAGFFMTLFVRRIGGSRAGSIFSGIAFTLCGFMTGWQGQPMDDSGTWLPLMCYAVLRLADAGSKRWIALAAFAFAMPVLAGHPETAAHVTLVTIAIAAVTWASSQFDLRFAGRFSIAAVLAGGLSSIQMIPTLEWLAQIPRAFQPRWPLQPAHQVLAWVSRDIARYLNSAGISLPEGAAYVGMITLIAAPLGLLHRSKKNVLFLAAVILAALAIAYGVEPVNSFIAQVPIVSGLKNSRMIFLAGFGLIGLAGLGISALEQNPPFGSRRLLPFLLLMTSFAAVFLLVYKLRIATEFRVEFTRRPSFSRAMLILGTLPFLLRLFRRLSAPAFARIACAILALDLVTFSYGFMGYAAADEIFPKSSVFDFIAKNADPSHFRIAEVGDPYPANSPSVYGIATADGYEVRLPALQSVFSQDFADKTQTGLVFTPGRLLWFNDRRLDLLNVKYVVIPTDSPEFERFRSVGRYSVAFDNGYIAAFENKTVLPRAFLVTVKGMTVLPEISDQLGLLRDSTFDPQKAFTVSAPPAALKKQTQPSANPLLSRQADVVSSHINDISIRVASPDDSALILSQTYYPGWYAEIDGTRTEVFRTDLTLTGVIVPAGLHDVRFVFRPNSFLLGAMLSAISAAVLLFLSSAPASPRYQ